MKRAVDVASVTNEILKYFAIVLQKLTSSSSEKDSK